jgi:hypothetical protein
MTPFLDIPLDGFLYVTSFTFPASMTPERRWLQNDRVNALRQSTLYNFKGRVAKPPVVANQLSYIGQVRATPGSWLYGVSNSAGPAVRFWDSAGNNFTQGIPIGGTAGFQTFRNGMTAGLFILMPEPWFLLDGIINYEVHTSGANLCFFLCEPREEIRGELLSACMDTRAVEF